MSALLFYGPSALSTARQYIEEHGILIGAPFGEGGLKVEAARDFVSMMSRHHIGPQRKFLLVGPMEEATPTASDVLLKTLEEFDPAVATPILWASSVDAVVPTVVSRCVLKWCYSEVETSPLSAACADFCSHYISSDFASLLSLLKAHKKEIRNFAHVLPSALKGHVADNVAISNLWKNLRLLLVDPLRITYLSFLDCVLRSRI